MMNKKLLTMLLVAGMAVMFITTGLYAGTEFSDNITMDYNQYTKRKKAPPKSKFVEFSHLAHNVDYKISCGACHHNDKNEPLNDLEKDVTDVQKCVACHTKLEKDKNDKKDIMVLENAMHGNCVDCHKDVNKKAGDPKGMKGPAPASCAKCHVSLKKK